MEVEVSCQQDHQQDQSFLQKRGRRRIHGWYNAGCFQSICVFLTIFFSLLDEVDLNTIMVCDKTIRLDCVTDPQEMQALQGFDPNLSEKAMAVMCTPGWLVLHE